MISRAKAADNREGKGEREGRKVSPSGKYERKRASSSSEILRGLTWRDVSQKYSTQLIISPAEPTSAVVIRQLRGGGGGAVLRVVRKVVFCRNRERRFFRSNIRKINE